jgi:hypothetical protein
MWPWGERFMTPAGCLRVGTRYSGQTQAWWAGRQGRGTVGRRCTAAQETAVLAWGAPLAYRLPVCLACSGRGGHCCHQCCQRCCHRCLTGRLHLVTRLHRLARWGFWACAEGWGWRGRASRPTLRGRTGFWACLSAAVRAQSGASSLPAWTW